MITNVPSRWRLYTSGVTRSIPDLAPMWCRRRSGVSVRGPPTRPAVARNSSMIRLSRVARAVICLLRSEAVGEVDAARGHGLRRDELERVALVDRVEEARPASYEHGVHDQAKLVEQVGADEAGDQSWAADHV